MFFGGSHLIDNCGEADAIHVEDNFPKFLTENDALSTKNRTDDIPSGESVLAPSHAVSHDYDCFFLGLHGGIEAFVEK